MIFLHVFARGHHGYPQPEDDYYNFVNQNFCARCGIHGQRIAPFRCKRTQREPDSSFVQQNWVLDAFFVHPEVAAPLASAGISGISLSLAVDHRTGSELKDRLELLTSTVINCAEMSRLPVVTCRPDNEERQLKFLGGRKRYNTLSPYCGGVKHYPPISRAVKSDTLGDAPDLFQTARWFGSGGAAYRLTLCSERFVELVTLRGRRGLEFRSVQDHGWSERKTGTT